MQIYSLVIWLGFKPGLRLDFRKVSRRHLSASCCYAALRGLSKSLLELIAGFPVDSVLSIKPSLDLGKYPTLALFFTL